MPAIKELQHSLLLYLQYAQRPDHLVKTVHKLVDIIDDVDITRKESDIQQLSLFLTLAMVEAMIQKLIEAHGDDETAHGDEYRKLVSNLLTVAADNSHLVDKITAKYNILQVIKRLFPTLVMPDATYES